VAILNEVAEVFASIGEKSSMRRFFDEIFTPNERADIALRWQILRLLHEKKTQREVAAKLGVSLCKVTRGAKVLKRPDTVSKRILCSFDKTRSRT
jgi:TrpR family transcriptional regulator, trp operon repressor